MFTGIHLDLGGIPHGSALIHSSSSALPRMATRQRPCGAERLNFACSRRRGPQTPAGRLPAADRTPGGPKPDAGCHPPEGIRGDPQ